MGKRMDEAQFLNNLEKKLWNAADKLRSNIDAAEYKHVVLGLIFLKYVSDAFAERQSALEAILRDENHEYGVLRKNCASDEEYEATIKNELEIRDYYIEENVFWVPALARWENLQKNARVAPGTAIEIKNGKKDTYKFTSIGKLIDDALEAIEKENPKLKNVLDKNYARRQIDPNILGQLIDKIAEVPFHYETLNAKDILGHVYEYCLGQFALNEGKKGGQFYTPKAIVTLIVEMLQPWKGRVYDPAMGSGGFFVQSERFIEEHKGKLRNLSVYGQESNPTTWRLAAMNMAIRGIDFNFGGAPANTFSNDKHPDLRADFVMANPPFNMKEWNTGVKDDDRRWQYGAPPANNANFAWMQHMLYHLAPNGSMGLLLANGSMSSNTSNEGEIRKRLLEEDRVECMVALPGQLFTNTQIPACIWFLTKNKKASSSHSRESSRHSSEPSHYSREPSRHSRESGNPGFRNRTGEVLFIDARHLGYMKDRVLRDFTPEDITKIADTFQSWRHSCEPSHHSHEPHSSESSRHSHEPSHHSHEPHSCEPSHHSHEPHSCEPSHHSHEPHSSESSRHSHEPSHHSHEPHSCEPSHHSSESSRHSRESGNPEVSEYEDIAGFCKSVTLDEIKKHDYVLTPGRYVGAAEEDDGGEPFEEKMARLTARLKDQFEQSDKLEAEIKKNLAGLGYEF